MMVVFDIINIQYETADEDFPESMTSILITQDEHWGKTHKVKEMIKLKMNLIFLKHSEKILMSLVFWKLTGGWKNEQY